MRLHLLLPKVDPKAIPVPSKCAYADCTSKQVRLHQQVQVHRYRCLSGLALTIDAVSAEDAQTLKNWIEPARQSSPRLVWQLSQQRWGQSSHAASVSRGKQGT